MKKKLFLILTLLLAAILCFALVACDEDGHQNYNKPNNGNQSSGNQCGGPPYPPYMVDRTLATAFITIDINPSIELTTNYDNTVLSAYGANDDGKILLYGEDGIVGKDIKTAIAKITSLAIEMGYLTDSNSTVQTSVTATEDTYDHSQSGDTISDVVSEQIIKTASEKDLKVSVSGLSSYSLMRRFEEFKEKYIGKINTTSLTFDEFKILSSAAEALGISADEAAELDTHELLQAVNKDHKQAKAFETEAYKTDCAKADDLYQKALGAVTDGIYTTYYILHHPLRAYYGLAYQGYKLTARGLKAIANAVDYLGELREYPLNEAQIERITGILGLENADEIKNANGDVTVKSIEAYADKKFKETELSATLEEMKANLTSALKTVESEIKATIDGLAQQFAPEIEVIKQSLSSIVDGLKGFESILPQPIQSAINDFSDLVTSLAGVLSDFKITVTEIRELSDKAFKKSDLALNQIHNDLTPDELDEVADWQQTAIDGIEEARRQLEDAFKNAEQSAKAQIEQIKSERKVA